MLQEVQQITETPPTQAQRNTSETESPIPPATFLGTQRSLHMGAGLPPVPAKLVARIEAGEFVDMAELLPNKLGFSKTTLNDDQARPSKSRRRTVINILEWTQCFATYVHGSGLQEATRAHARPAGLYNTHYRGQHGI